MSAIAAVLLRTSASGEAIVGAMLHASPHRGDRLETQASRLAASGIANHQDLPESTTSRDGNWISVFTGTLDNLGEVRAELSSHGVHVEGSSPAQVILTAFRKWREELPARLRGTYAVAMTDGVTLWAWRDHLGMRSLFYRDDPRGCFVATEAKQVLAGAGLQRQPDHDVLPRLFYGVYDDHTPAALRGVRRLPKATLLCANESTVRLTRYWNPERLLETQRLSPELVAEGFAEVMRRAVRRALTGHDVISLSGGIDSPTIAAFAAEACRERPGTTLAALAAVFPDLPSVDESVFIGAVASHLGLPLYTYQKRAAPLDRLGEWVRLLDAPVPKILVTDAEEHFLVARRLGFRSMLTGEVAELVVDMPGSLNAYLLFRGRLGALRRRMMAQRARGATWPGIVWQALYAFLPGSIEAAFLRHRGFLGRTDLPRWIDPRRANEAAAAFLVPARRRWPQLQFAGFVGPGLTMEATEIVQATSGVRVRMPWADVDVWEFFLSLPAEQKLPGAARKELIRNAMRGKVPDAVLNRTEKTVFRDSMIARADYGAFRHWLIDTPYRMDGVDYGRLAERIDQRDFTIQEFLWAKSLAAIHAFATS